MCTRKSFDKADLSLTLRVELDGQVIRKAKLAIGGMSNKPLVEDNVAKELIEK